MIAHYFALPLKGRSLIMTQPQHHKKTPDRVCPRCGATEGVLRVLNYYFCESCHQKEELAKKVLSQTVPSNSHR
jgi:hypothetical protein